MLIQIHFKLINKLSETFNIRREEIAIASYCFNKRNNTDKVYTHTLKHKQKKNQINKPCHTHTHTTTKK